MTQIVDLQHNTTTTLNKYIIELKTAFPKIQHVILDQPILNSPLLKKLANLIKFSIPIHTYELQTLKLYEQITQKYYSQILRIPAALRLDIPILPEMINNADQHDAEIVEPIVEEPQKKLTRARFNYKQMAKFIQSYNGQFNDKVNSQLINQAQIFDSWKIKQVTHKDSGTKQYIKRNSRKQSSYQQKVPQKQRQRKVETVGIMLGRNMSLQAKLMKNQLIKRAQNNKFLTSDQLLTKIQKIGTQINYILNRMTQQYFNDFLSQLIPYAQNQFHSIILSQKIIQKILQEHNYINLYTKLVKSIKNISILQQPTSTLQQTTSTLNLKFRNIFTSCLQDQFYKLIRDRSHQEKEQQYKKYIIGISLFIGSLINKHIISKNIFRDCFYELITSYIQEYYLHCDNKSYYLHQIFVECIIKMIEKMADKYDKLIKRKESAEIEDIMAFLLKNYQDKNVNFQFNCNYIDLLKEINRKLPSQRYKIKFLLEDFRCNLALRRNIDKDNDEEEEVLQDLFNIDLKDKAKISGMISNMNPQKIMGKFLMQFAQGNLNQVNKNIEIYRCMISSPEIISATLKILKEKIQNLFTIQSDYPFLCQGLAQILKIICDSKRIQWQQLYLTDEDEDIMQFIDKIQTKYYKLIVED